MDIIRGRNLFSRFRFLLRTVTQIFQFVPLWVRQILWGWLDLGRGNVTIGFRYALLNSLIAECGDVIYIGPNVEIRHPMKLRLGSNISIHRGCYIDADGGIEIGKNVSIAHYSSILSFEHTWGNIKVPIRDNPIERKKVIIENDVWIGCGVRVLAGVHIGQRSIISAGAVVTCDLKGNALYGGIPARKLKNLS